MNELVRDFWKRFIASNEIERIEILKPIARIVSNTATAIENEELRIHAVAELLKSYFEDLIEVLTPSAQEELEED